MTSFILVHGGAQGGWCWDRLIPHLRAAPAPPREVIAVDLPGHGNRRLADHRHIGLHDSATTIVDAAVADGLDDVVLVGHAMGAIAVIEAAPMMADRLEGLVFLAGMIPSDGMSADETLSTRYDGQPSQWERIGDTPEREVYGADMTDADAAWFFARLTPPEDRPYQPPRTPVFVSRLPAEVPVSYIVQTSDQSFSPDLQRRMLAHLASPRVLEIDAGRNSMISQPEGLARLLLS